MTKYEDSIKASAAHGAARNQKIVGIRPGSEGLVPC